jgi:histidine triad (HIT) family protein
MSENCIFCQIIAKQLPTDILYEDQFVIVFKDIRPKARVHLLIIPKEHIQSLAHFPKEKATLAAHMLLLLPSLALTQGLETGFRTVINTGSGGGQEIDHIHFHLLGGGVYTKL